MLGSRAISLTRQKMINEALHECEESGVSDWASIKSVVRDSLRQFLYEQTKRKPMILPIIMEV